MKQHKSKILIMLHQRIEGFIKYALDTIIFLQFLIITNTQKWILNSANCFKDRLYLLHSVNESFEIKSEDIKFCELLNTTFIRYYKTSPKILNVENFNLFLYIYCTLLYNGYTQSIIADMMHNAKINVVKDLYYCYLVNLMNYLPGKLNYPVFITNKEIQKKFIRKCLTYRY